VGELIEPEAGSDGQEVGEMVAPDGSDEGTESPERDGALAESEVTGP
jgi:hypothetical protein